ncbi:hypothetical protein GCM10022212_18100 [Actimicrobium antarcticum]|uniref:histidine kinase n=1 Tax=Actimicrobium antarcticum TaxID=1051899 RepID=A0ABP7T5Z5_9BURK
MVSLALTCLIPGVLGAGILFNHRYQQEKIQLQLDALRISQVLALAVDGEWLDALHIAQALSASDYFGQGNLSALHAQTLALLQKTGIGAVTVVTDRTGQQQLNTVLPFKSALPMHANWPHLQRVLATGQYAISDLYHGATTGRLLASVDVPVVVHGQIQYSLGISVYAEQFAGMLRKQRLPPNWTATIVDSKGIIVARSMAHSMAPIKLDMNAGPLPQSAIGINEGLMDFKSMEGVAMRGAFTRATVSGWHVVVGIPNAILEKELRDGIYLFGLALVTLFGIGISLAWLMGNRIAHSVRALTAPAIALEAGEAVLVTKVHFREAEEVASAMAGTARLLLKRKKILQERELELLTAQRLARIGSWQWYFGSNTVEASAETCRMFGRTDIPMFSAQKNTLFAPSVWDTIHDALYRTATLGESCDLEVPARRATGDTFWVHYCCEAIRSTRGTIFGLRGTVQDITERRRSQAELERYRHDLETQVASRTVELELARDAAESANRAKSDFLATMSHELRTPLNAVIGLTRLLADSPLGLRQRDFADKITSSAQALRALIDDILDFSRIEAGKLELENAPFSLNDILRTTATVIGIGIADKPVEACFDIEADIPDALIGDALRLQQILLNLTSNAAKFTATGTIAVSLRCLARTPQDVTLQFSVRDTGIGIAVDQLPHVFEHFGQADSSTTRRYGGSGLGLAISKRLANLMDGWIDIDTVPGQGSEFRFGVTLRSGPPALSPAVRHLAGLRVLIVEDHALARTLLARYCTAFGWHTTTCEDGPSALDELQHSAAAGTDYDVVLLDWHLPRMNGVDLLRQVRAMPEISMPTVILLAPAIALEQALTAGDVLDIDRILIKPVIPASLFDAVERAYLGELESLCQRSVESETHGKLVGLTFLVAEDNLINQELIAQTLRRAGAAVVVMVDDGMGAVAALRADHDSFDVVLMDIRMPVLDGCAATRVIRTELGLDTLPVIALTAFADTAERDRFQQAGMSGYLAKPLDVDALLALLEGLLPGPHASANPVPVDAQIGSDFVALDIPAGLQAFGGDATKYAAILRQFIDSHANDATRARQLFDAGASTEAIDLAHGLAGMARLLRAPALASTASAAETALRDGDGGAACALLDTLCMSMLALTDAINAFDTGRNQTQ